MNMYGHSIEYMLNGSQIIGEHYTYNDCEENYREYTVIYIYDETGSPIGLKYREPSYAEGVYKCYFFEKNLQGDIIGVFNSLGTKIGAYNYDAWGNFTIDSIATGLEREIVYEINPFRYRGYYYDTETGWYYLQSRYYNPIWGRFINPDDHNVLTATPDQLTDKNLFAYCDNNTIMRLDDDGEFWNIIAGAAIGVIINVGVSFVSAMISGDEYTWKDAVVDAVSWAAIGAAASTGGGVIAQTVVGAFVGGGSSILSDAINGEEIDLVRAANSAAIGGFGGFLGGPGIRTDPVFSGITSKFTTRLTKAILPAVFKTGMTFTGTAALGAMGMRIYDRINP